MDNRKHFTSKLLSAKWIIPISLCAFVLTALFTLSACAQASDSESNTQATQESTSETTTDGFIPHGTTYGKSETVAVSSDLSGTMRDIAVTEWIKNPDEYGTIQDASQLNGITIEDSSTGVSFTQEGEQLTWTTNGQDIKYAGITDKELPFDLSYSYKLNGEEVDPSNLKNVTGTLEVSITYENKTSDQLEVNGSTYDIQTPYIMASMISFDPKHAKNISITNGTVMDMDGQTMVVGLGMPGLSQTLGIEDQVALPDSVTITAEVCNFDMPSITTMVTSQILSLLGTTAQDGKASLSSLFDQASQLENGFNTIAQGTEGLNQALSKVSEGQKGMTEALPQAAEGLGTLAQSSAQLQTTLKSATVDSNDPNIATLQALLSNEQSADNLTPEQETALETIISQYQTMNTTLQAGSEAAGTLSATLTKSSDSLSQLEGGLTQLNQALGQIQEGMTTLSTATASAGDGISQTLSQARTALYSKLDLVQALADYTDRQGAFCGSAEDMEANTVFTITASAE